MRAIADQRRGIADENDSNPFALKVNSNIQRDLQIKKDYEDERLEQVLDCISQLIEEGNYQGVEMPELNDRFFAELGYFW